MFTISEKTSPNVIQNIAKQPKVLTLNCLPTSSERRVADFISRGSSFSTIHDLFHLYFMSRADGAVRTPRFEGEDVSPTTERELRGWYSTGLAAEIFAVCGVGMVYVM